MDKYYIELKKEDQYKYIQIYYHIKHQIDKNIIKDGEKLKTVRELSKLLHVNNVTIVNAYRKLESEGYAVSKPGNGTYAKRRESFLKLNRQYSSFIKRMSVEMMKNYIDFSGESTSSFFLPVDRFKSVLNEILDRDGANALIYQDLIGYKGLRNSINNCFWDGNININNILIVSGAQQGIDVVSKALLNVNDNVIVEKPTYNGALSVFRWRRVNIFEIEVNDKGIDIEKFEEVLKKHKIKLFYTMSYFQNPTTISYSKEVKEKILYLAEKYDFYIVEDDYLSELIFDSNIKYNSFKSLDKFNRVIYIKSFSKIFLPGIRLGYLISPGKFCEVIQNSKINTDIATSSLMQRALDIFLERNYWGENLKILKDLYKKRYDFMNDYMNEVFNGVASFKSPGGGLNFYIKLNDNIIINSFDLFKMCKKEKVAVTPGGIFYKNPDEGKRFFRLNYSQTPEDKIKEGLNKICAILKQNTIR